MLLFCGNFLLTSILESQIFTHPPRVCRNEPYALECCLQTTALVCGFDFQWLWFLHKFLERKTLRVSCRMGLFQTETSHVRLHSSSMAHSSSHQTCILPPYHREGFVSRPKEQL